VSGGLLPLPFAATESDGKSLSEDENRAAWEQYRKAFAS
jgi:hypothetical protein